MIEQPVFITVHGIDGTGKTTTTQDLTAHLNSIGHPTINYDVFEKEQLKSPFSDSKRRVTAEASPEAQFAFYIGSTIFHSDRISSLLADGTSVVKTRYLDDVLAHHAHVGVANVKEIAELFPIRKPDLKLILVLSEEIRRQRLGRRGEVDDKDKDIKQPGSRAAFFEEYLFSVSSESLKNGTALELDTGILQRHEVVNIVGRHIRTIFERKP